MSGRWILARRRCCNAAAPQTTSLCAGVVQHTACQDAMATLVLNGSVCCIRLPASPRFAPSKAAHTKCSGIVSQAIAETITVIKNNTGGSDPTDNHIINGEPIFAQADKQQHLEYCFAVKQYVENHRKASFLTATPTYFSSQARYGHAIPAWQAFPSSQWLFQASLLHALLTGWATQATVRALLPQHTGVSTSKPIF